MEPLWKKYESDFNNLTDDQVKMETDQAQRDVEEAQDWIEAVASWEAAGKPRKSSNAASGHPGLRQEGDEFYCPTCTKRWDTHEDAPPCAD